MLRYNLRVSVQNWIETQVCLQLPTSADIVTLLAFAAERRAAAAPADRRDQSVSPARRAHSSKPAAAACSGR